MSKDLFVPFSGYFFNGLPEYQYPSQEGYTFLRCEIAYKDPDGNVASGWWFTKNE